MSRRTWKIVVWPARTRSSPSCGRVSRRDSGATLSTPYSGDGHRLVGWRVLKRSSSAIGTISQTSRLREPSAFADLLSLDLRVGLISDGWPSAQRAKLDALGVGDSFASKVLTGDWAGGFAKPHHRAFTRIEQELSLSRSELVYVADNPIKDFIAPNERGWLTWRIRMPGQLHQALEPNMSIAAPGLDLPSLQDVVAEYRAGS